MAEMTPQRTSYERVVAGAFVAMALMLCGVAIFAALTLNRLVAEKDAVILEGEELAELEHVRATTEREARILRSWLLLRNVDVVSELKTMHRDLDRGFSELDRHIEDPESRRLLTQVQEAERSHRAALDSLVRDGQGDPTDLVSRFESDLLPVRLQLDEALDQLVQRERALLQASSQESRTTARWALGLLVGVASVALLGGVALGSVLRDVLRVQARQRAELERHVELTDAANRDLDAFAGRIAHDLKNALAPAVLAVSRLKLAERGAQGTPVTRADAALRRSVRMLDSLLAFSRAGARSDPTASCDVRQVLDGVLDEVEPARAEADATFVVDAPPGARAQTSDALLHTVLANLVGNALKYVRGRPARRVRIHVTEEPRDVLRLVVEDTGPGISAEHATRIFDAFYRVPGQSVAGTGIGLATVKRIVDAQGGSVRVSRGQEGGARFELTLPAAHPDTTEEASERAGPEQPPETAAPINRA